LKVCGNNDKASSTQHETNHSEAKTHKHGENLLHGDKECMDASLQGKGLKGGKLSLHVQHKSQQFSIL